MTIYLYSARGGFMPQAQLDALLDARRAPPVEPRPPIRWVTPPDVARMRELRGLGWSLARIAAEVGRDAHTVWRWAR